MKKTSLIMGMPITIEVVDSGVSLDDIEAIFDYFRYVDKTFSTYKENSEISRINKGLLEKSKWSPDMKEIFVLADKTKKETNGYFDIFCKGRYDPSGIVKGWSIYNGAQLLKKRGFKNFYVDAGGDIQVSGHNAKGMRWTVGIRNPFNRYEIVKKLSVRSEGVATSGTAIRGQHIYNPFEPNMKQTEIVSLTVVGPSVYDADRFATAAFAMGKDGIEFIESLHGFEGYMIDARGMATYTSRFDSHVC